MQAKKITEHELVKLCMQLLCKTYGFADCENMIQRDLQFLCEQIEEKTGVLISLSTVKRLLNGSFLRMPQIATLDAIAMTLGHKNWQDFKLRNTGRITENKTDGISAPAKNKNFYRIAFVVLIMALSLVCVKYLVKSQAHDIGNADKSSFSATKVMGNTIPNTVIFKYNVDSVDADSFFIQQSWDWRRRVRVYKNNYTLTDIYYEPGYHTAKLIANNKIIRRLYVSIPTDKWFFYVKDNAPKSIPKYIHTDGIKGGAMQLTRQGILDSKADIQKECQVAELYFPSQIRYSSDNFILNYKVKINKLNNEACPYLMSEVFCQNHFMYFKTTPKGCTSNLDIDFGEHFLYGKTSDLSALGSDVTNWQDMQFKVENRQVTISINGKAAFKSSFKQSCGLITGLGFISNGLCEVSFVDLKTIGGKVIYSRDFSKPGQASFK